MKILNVKNKSANKIEYCVIYLLFFSVFFLGSCSPDAKNTPESVIKDIVLSNRPLLYYTSKTRSLLYDLNTSGSISNASALLPLVSSGIRVKISKKTTSFRSVILYVKFMDHPSENIIGSIMPVKMVVESGLWRIDRSDVLSQYIDRNTKNEEKYLRDLKSQYN